MSDDFHDLSARLRAMADKPQTPARRAEVMAALKHKHEGVQSLALQRLGEWGDKDAVKALKAFLTASYSRPGGDSLRGVAIHALAPWITARDADPVLDLYLGPLEVVAKHALLPLVLRLPPASARHRLVRALRDPDRANRQAAVKAIGNMTFPDRKALIQPLCDDPDDFVASSARLMAR